LTARHVEQLTSLCHEFGDDPNLKIDVVPGSLDDTSTLEALECKMSSLSIEFPFDQVLVVNNAGSLGDASRLTDDYSSRDFEELQNYYAVNVTSFICLTASFLKIFKSIESKIIVNISSLVAVSPIKGMSVYGTGKAARDAFIRSIVLEDETVTALNYAPGPLETDMAQQLRDNSHVKEFFSDPKNVLKPEDTVKKLVKLISTDGSFVNGSHVDYFDVE